MSVKITGHQFEDIPYTRYQDTSLPPENRKLLFFFHGFTSNRTKGIMGRGERLAELGYTVIAMDAYAHGDRYAPELLDNTPGEKYKHLIDIIIHTANDTSKLYENSLKDDPRMNSDTFSVYGASMGAAISFLVASSMEECDSVVSIVGSPSLYELYAYKQSLYQWPKDEIWHERMTRYEKIDPLIHSDSLCKKPIFFGCGTHDKVVPPRYAKALYEKCKSPKHVFRTYDVGHTSTDEMLEDSYTFLKSMHPQTTNMEGSQ